MAIARDTDLEEGFASNGWDEILDSDAVLERIMDSNIHPLFDESITKAEEDEYENWDWWA